MKKSPPKLPELFYPEYDLNKNKNPKKETYGDISECKVPNTFFCHLLTKKEKKYIRSCMTQRNKKKLLTIVYYSP